MASPINTDEGSAYNATGDNNPQAQSLAQSMQGLTTTGFTTLPLVHRLKDPAAVVYTGPRPGQPGFVYVSTIAPITKFRLV